MVGVYPACGYQFIPDRLGERNVYEAVGMHMTDLASREAILRSAEPMRAARHPWPVLYSAMDFSMGAPNWHQTPILADRILGLRTQRYLSYLSDVSSLTKMPITDGLTVRVGDSAPGWM